MTGPLPAASDGTEDADVASEPRLVFRLPGRWDVVTLTDEPRRIDDVERLVRSRIGVADDRAWERARLRAELERATTTAAGAGGRTMFFAGDLDAGHPLPLTLTVYAPRSMSMSPAVGTSESAVLEVFAEGIARLDPDRAATQRRVPFVGGAALRVHTIDEAPLELVEPASDVEQAPPAPRLEAQYWYAIPGSKRLGLASFVTPLGIIPETMLSYFDAIVGASRFEAADHPRPRAASLD